MRKRIVIGLILSLLITILVWQRIETPTPSIQEVEPSLLTIPAYIDDANRHRWVMRGGQFDQQKVLKAREITKQKFKKQRNYKDAGITSWTNLGPGNIGGRIRAIATYRLPKVNEDVIFVGGAGGGIWKSTDSGDNWTALTDFSPSLAVTSIVIDPDDNNTIYASTGEGHAFQTIGLPGAGIFKSTNGGTTWNQLASTNNSDFLWVNKLAINPSNGDHLLAVTANVNISGGNFPFQQFSGEGKLFESLNGGTTWTEVLSNPQGILTDVEFHPFNSNVRVVSGRGNVFVYNSSNGTYESKRTLLNNYPGRMEVTLCGINANVMYALVSTEVAATDGTNLAAIYKSSNGGSTWDFRGVHPEVFRSTTLGSYANNIWVDPTDCDDIYFGGVDLWKSTDSGQNITKISDWQLYRAFINADIDEDIQLHADQHIIVPAANYSSLNRRVFIGNDGGIQKANNIRSGSTNLLSGWDNLLGSGLGITQYYGVGSSPIVNKFGGGAQDNGANLRSGSVWTQPSNGDGQDMIFHPTNQNIVYANVNNNLLKKSTDGGATFSDVASLGEANASLIAPMAMDMTDPDHVYLCGYALWRYDDGTGNTTMVKNTLPDIGNFKQEITAIDIHETTGVIWVGYNTGIVEYSINGGLTWSGDITSTPNAAQIPNNAVTDIDIYDDVFGRQAYVTIGGYRENNIWNVDVSDIGNPTAFDRSMDFEMQVNTIAHHPENENWIYVGTDVGIFASEDAGVNWSVTPLFDENSGPEFENEGPVFTEVTDLEWDFESFAGSYNLVAGTFGRGLWLSSNILTDVFVDRTFSPGAPTFGTRTKPYRPFTQAIDKAENKGSSVIFLEGGTYNNINPGQSRLFTKRTLIKSEATNSAIIE